MRTDYLKNLNEPIEPQFNLENRVNHEPIQPGQTIDFILKNENWVLWVVEPKISSSSIIIFIFYLQGL